jgi:hypothetical protein
MPPICRHYAEPELVGFEKAWDEHNAHPLEGEGLAKRLCDWCKPHFKAGYTAGAKDERVRVIGELRDLVDHGATIETILDTLEEGEG